MRLVLFLHWVFISPLMIEYTEYIYIYTYIRGSIPLHLTYCLLGLLSSSPSDFHCTFSLYAAPCPTRKNYATLAALNRLLVISDRSSSWFTCLLVHSSSGLEQSSPVAAHVHLPRVLSSILASNTHVSFYTARRCSVWGLVPPHGRHSSEESWMGGLYGNGNGSSG